MSHPSVYDNRSAWKDSNNFTMILNAILSSTPPQYHFIVVTILWDAIKSDDRPEVQTALMLGLKNLNSTGNLAGMTVPELLDICVQQLEKTTSGPAPNLSVCEAIVAVIGNSHLFRILGSKSSLSEPSQRDFRVPVEQIGKMASC
jgi:hypothetical protein